ncbi:Csu type fimbrial protein [Tatumella sp. UBA2305]|uniref:Csu type fimbrial protein n=1 Tax=Tatumella sp. UBA2305 TaxID=1947647 RepID=UPI0025DE0F79|nr:spore coat U domain-containing protein [Tatumella sp. UBA2305]
MPVIRILLLIIVTGLGLGFSASASADSNCWNGGGTTFSFGTVTAGQAASTSGQIPFTCSNYNSVPEYVRACLYLQDTAPLAMNPNGVSGYPLYFNLYPGGDSGVALGANSAVFAQQDFLLAAGQTTEQDFTLIGRIVAGQSKLAALDYYNYSIWSVIKYVYATSSNQLPSCAAMPATNTRTVQLSANSVVKNGCMINDVSDLNFGQQSPATSSSLSGTSTSTVTVTCPVNTAFSIGLGNGLHSQQSTRYLCNTEDNQCVSYQLYQDAAHSKVWNDTNTQTVLSATGASQSLSVYGVVPTQRWPTPGHYSDIVTVTLNY